MAPKEEDWEIRWSNTRGRPYFYSPTTKESLWDPPDNMTNEQVVKLPGAHHLRRASTNTSVASAPVERAPPGKVRASHLLVKHTGSRRPASWRADPITTTKEEATNIITGYLNELRASSTLAADFAKLAGEYSDCSSHVTGGDLGSFGRGQMQKAFEEATYALKPGEMSGIVDTDSGLHLILRTA